MTQAAHRLNAAAEAGDKESIRSAVRLNWRLWTILQAELLDPECIVPEDIRTNMLSLANFVDKRSVDVIGRPAGEKLAVLIAINRELAAGLFSEVEAPLEPVAGFGPRLTDPARAPRTAGLRSST